MSKNFLGVFSSSQIEDLLSHLAYDSLRSCAFHFPILLIDGPSGSGKSTLARFLASELPLVNSARWEGVKVLPLDDFYPGWDGLQAAQEILWKDILYPLSENRPGYYRGWDWNLDIAGSEHLLSPSFPLIVEGCGSVFAQTVKLSDFQIWLELSAPERKRRALARDGEVFAPHWERWAAQERKHWQVNSPRALAGFNLCQPDSF
ncbi:AAA family ATPase [Actinomycetaceae bacterium TAE3-ERU4]|nr:AAA family ATPase [Actinomycetaceae bacterium TAE3-ERU4]